MPNSEPTPIQPPEQEHRLAYHRELDMVAASVMRLGAMACETIPKGTDALLSGDLQAAQALIDGDDDLDRLTLEIEERCTNIIALQAPMASELRRVLTIMKLVAEIERSADLMVNVCKASRRMYGAQLGPRLRGLLTSMSKEATKLLRLSLDAFADENVSLARALGDIDNELDQLNRDMVGAIFEAHSDGSIDLGAAVQLALIARYYERIGDHAVNNGERIVYMVTGWQPEQAAVMRHEARQAKASAVAEENVEPSAATDGDRQDGG